MTAQEFSDQLRVHGCTTRDRRNWTCPAHHDQEPSLSVGTGDDGRVLIRCHAGCTTEAVVAALGLEVSDLFPRRERATVQSPASSSSNSGDSRLHEPAQAVAPLRPDATLAAYAAAKRLPEDFLARLGLRTQPYLGGTAIRIPYLDESGEEVAVRFRQYLEAEPRFKWKTNAKPILYGLHRLANAQALGSVVLVEGESDCHTLWLNGIPALGIPGANSWRPEWARALDGIGTVFVVRETDAPGAALCKKLIAGALRDRLRIVDLGAKDVSELYLRDSADFERAFGEALDRSTVAVEEQRAAEESEREERGREAWERCADLARAPRILDRVADELRARGLVGALCLAKLIYLAVTSRLLSRIISLVAKGPSAVGKSYETERTIELFPASAIYTLTAMSEHALAYSEEPLEHRMIVIYEAAGVESDFASYLLRSLLSEGCIRYETVEKTKDGIRARLIERPGPTGAILTTTRLTLHPENETRLLSVPVDDSTEQTRKVLEALALEDGGAEHDNEPWHALQDWLTSAGERRVSIPFASVLAKAVPPVAVRLRRDFGLLLALLRAHALLHQATRERDERGRIVATVADDYAVVHELAADLLGEGVSATVSASTRETVSAVSIEMLKSATPENPERSATNVAVARELGLDPGATSRRVRAAVAAGYLTNLETRKGRPARLVLGDPLPEDRPLLPTPDELLGRLQGDCEGFSEPVQPPTHQEHSGNGAPLHDCTTNDGVGNGHFRIAPLAPGPLRDDWEELAGKYEAEGMARDEAEYLAADQLGLLIRAVN